MIRLIVISLLLILFSATIHHVANAQEAQPDTEQSLLPEIDPQDIEIRSQFQARFPGLRRQPILGFNPRPRVFQTDPDRMPFIEDEEQQMASLPIGDLDRPEPPVYQRLGYADPRTAFFRGGIGSELSPEADLFAVARITDQNWVSGNVKFHSSDGHAENVATSFRFLDADVSSYNRLSSRTNVRFGAGVTSNFNHMPQLVTGAEEFLEANTRVSRTGFRGNTEIQVANTSLTGTDLFLDGYFNDYKLNSDVAGFGGEASEWGIHAGAAYSRLGSNLNEIHRLKFQTKAGGVTPLEMESGNWSVSTLSAHYERLFNFRTDVKASLGISGVSDAVDDFTLRLAPEIELKHRFFTGFNIRGKASAKPAHYSFAEIQQKNLFFDMNSALRHQYNMMALGEIQLEPFYGTKIIGGVSFQDVKNYLYYSRSAPEGFSLIEEGYYTANFEDATIFRLYGGIAQDIRPDVFWLSADGYLQTPRLKDSNVRIPYTETISLKGTLSMKPAEALLIEGWGEYVGGRQSHHGDNLNSFLLFGTRLEFSLTDQYGVYVKLLNLLNEDYELWQGYRERGFQGYVGLTILF